MKVALQITHEPLPSREVLRLLISQSLQTIADKPMLLDVDMPCAGNPLIAVDSNKAPIVISFDQDEPEKALVMGLAARDDITSNRALIHRLYPVLTEDSILNNLHLVIMSPGTPPGITGLARSDSLLSAYTIRALRVNNELGLLVDLVAGTETRRQPTAKPAVQAVRARNNMSLTADESAYFAGLD